MLFFFGCGNDDAKTKNEQKKVGTTEGAVSSDVVARVDGVEIRAAQVRELIEDLDGGLNATEALDILVDNELLAAEAKRRGLASNQEVKDAKKIELARALLKTRIDKKVTHSTVDEEKLRALYETNKEHFVHTIQRRVRHILVHTGKKGVPDEEAASFASRIAEKASEIATLEEFVELYQSVKDEYPGKTRIESLKPFSIESERYLREFVDAAFAIPSVGQTSPPAKTEYGWHVIYVIEELPAENRSFEEVKQELAEQVLPLEKKYQFQKLLIDLKKRDGVFMFHTAEENSEPSP